MTNTSRNTSKVSGWIGWTLVVIVIITLIAGVAIQYGSPLLGSLFPKTPSPTASASPDSGKAKASSLVVTPADLLKAHYKPALCTSDAYLPYSLATTPGRVVTLGPSIPFASSDPSKILPQKFTHNCGDPTEVDMDIQMWKLVNVDGHNVYAANASWMDTCEAVADKDGLRAFLTLKAKHGTDEFVTKQYTFCAELDNALWLGLGVPVIASDKSLYNWYIPVQVSGELPRVALDPVPDTLVVAKFTVNDKTRKCVVSVGINPLDGRDEILPCTTTPPPCVGTSCTTHHTPGCTETNSCPCPEGKVRNQNGKCVVHKSSHPEGYVYPTDKPAAPNDGGTDTAPVVKTTPTPTPTVTQSPQPQVPAPSEAPTTCPIPAGETTC